MWFCIPAHGHHNPTLPVAAELVRRGDAVRYYSFEEFREKVEATGAEYVSCDRFLPGLSAWEEAALKRVSTTEMSVVALRTTGRMDDFLREQVEEFRPDVIVSDSVCFWGKLTARKYHIPLVVSTTTFAFNQSSSQYMKSSLAEIADLIGGSRRVKAELKALEKYGYHEKSIMPLVQNDNFTDTIVYATARYQPRSETFSGHYAFVGPSLSLPYEPAKDNRRPLVYISLGTVINERPEFYRRCAEALGGEDMDVVISCGRSVDVASLGELPENIRVYPYVNQPELLSRANVFLTHCGMNSVSESLYMGTPMVLFPQTNEQRAVARRAGELGAGLPLKGEGAADIRDAVRAVLAQESYAASAMACARDFRSAPGAAGAADFIESAPHELPEEDRRQRRSAMLAGWMQLLYWAVAVPLILLLPRWTAVRWWMAAIAANLLFGPYKKLLERKGGG